MKSALLRPIDSLKSQKSAPSTPTSSPQLQRESESQQVRLVEEELLREFETRLQQTEPVSDREVKQVRNTQLQSKYNAVRHANRVKEMKVAELGNVLKELILGNCKTPEVSLRAATSVATQRSQRNRCMSPHPVDPLLRQISDVEEGIDDADLEAERLSFLYENTQRATIESRNRFLALQKRGKLLLGKYEEIKDLREKAKYDLQHAKTEVMMFAESMRKEAEKRNEKLDLLRRDKNEVEEDAAKTVKLLAETLVKDRTSKTVAEAHAVELDVIYSKYMDCKKVQHHDAASIASLRAALMTICEVVNRSETLALEPKVKEVKLSDLIGFAHQFEMKMSSLESQVQSLSDWKHELELKCAEINKELSLLRANEFQSADLMYRIEEKLSKFGFQQPMTTYNQYKLFLETFDFSLDTEDVAHQDALLASSYMTLHIIARRITSLLESIVRQTGSQSEDIAGLIHALAASQRHGEKLEHAYTRSISPSGSEKSEAADPLDVDAATASIIFRDAFEDLPEWGLDVDSVIRQASEMLLIRLFAADPHLKPDIRSWKSAQLSIVPENFNLMFILKLVDFTHGYMRSRIGEVFVTLNSLIKTVVESRESIERQVNSVEMTEAQIRVLLDFRHMQATGNPAKMAISGGSEAIRRAFEQRYKKLMIQQIIERTEEELAEGVARGYTRKRYDSTADIAPIIDPIPSHATEEEFSSALRKLAKSASMREKPVIRSPSSIKTYALDSPSSLADELEAFAQVRAMNVRIRSIRNSEKPKTSIQTQRFLPDINSGDPSSTRVSNRKSVKSIYSERRSGKKKRTLKRVALDANVS